MAEKAIAKQPACAAAISSSGFVPAPDSKREPKEYSVFFSAPPGAVSEPLPALSEPVQTADAVRFIGKWVASSKEASRRSNATARTPAPQASTLTLKAPQLETIRRRRAGPHFSFTNSRMSPGWHFSSRHNASRVLKRTAFALLV